jgi:hypothetical protein
VRSSSSSLTGHPTGRPGGYEPGGAATSPRGAVPRPCPGWGSPFASPVRPPAARPRCRTTTAWVRSRTPSFASTAATCFLTVSRLTTSRAAISALDSPSPAGAAPRPPAG